MAIKFDPKELDEQYTLDKETIARTWFFVGSELKRMMRGIASPRLLGQHVAKSEFASVANYDRSVALWMFEHWRDVLDWLEAATARPPTDPFKQLAGLDASHPAHTKRQVLAWQRNRRRQDSTM